MTDSRPHVLHNTGKEEWGTPAYILEAARETLGFIALDPATNEEAQTRVQADHYYTREDDGLAHSWAGTVWLNPPYSRGKVDLFVNKLVHEYLWGGVTEALLLVNSAVGTKWFRHAAAFSDAMCLLNKRVRFLQNGVEVGSPTIGQVIFYFGSDDLAFADNFCELGIIYHNSD